MSNSREHSYCHLKIMNIPVIKRIQEYNISLTHDHLPVAARLSIIHYLWYSLIDWCFILTKTATDKDLSG